METTTKVHFPAEGSNLKKMLTDESYRQNFHSQLKKYNPIMAAFYKIGLLPLFGMSKNVMLLTTRGRKSGKLRSTPIGYFRVEGKLYLLSGWGKSTNWYRNMMAAPNEIWVQIGMKKWKVNAFVLEDSKDVMQLLERLVAESPESAKMLFGWRPGVDRIANADFSEIIDKVVFIRFDK